MDSAERGYFEDPRKIDFVSKVKTVEEQGDGTTLVWLDRTWFYPVSGGQPDDRGTLSGLNVISVTEDEHGVCHKVEGILSEGDQVEGHIDGERRLDHTRQHSGQHLLSRYFLEMFGCQTVGFHLGEKSSTIDIEIQDIPDEGIEEIERLVNGAVMRDLPIKTLIKDRADYEKEREDGSGKMIHRSRLRGDVDEVRVVEIGGIDSSTCCGTHCSSTGEIGPVKILATEKVRSTTRVEFVCGPRALSDYAGKHKVVSGLARLFSADWREVEDLTRKVKDENRELKKEKARLAGDLARMRASMLPEPSFTAGGLGIVAKDFDNEDASILREMANRIAEQGERVVLLGSSAPTPALVFASSPGHGLDMGRLMSMAAEVMGARGGGGKDFAQGGGGDGEKLSDAIAVAVKAVKEQLK